MDPEYSPPHTFPSSVLAVTLSTNFIQGGDGGNHFAPTYRHNVLKGN